MGADLAAQTAAHRFTADDLTNTLLALTRYARRALSLSHLALRSAGELTDLVAEMHAVISRAPLPFARLRPDAGAAPFPYRVVAGSLRQTAQALAAIPEARSEEGRASPGWRRFAAILNGVLGDKLEAWGNPLACTLDLHDAEGMRISPLALEAGAAPGGAVLLFAHGLCLSDLDWHNAEHEQWVAALRAQGHTVGYLRYNSGRAIYRNGQELSAFLNAHYGHDSTARLVLIGHSMGGLLFRSAFEYARRRGHGWVERVSHCACLAAPHHGAPLEKIGNMANSLLSFTPYTLPFMRLGNIRSRGIKDLRYACLVEEDSLLTDDERYSDPRQQQPALPAHIRHLFLSASLAANHGGEWLGDGMVPVASARGEHLREALRLSSPDLLRRHLEPLGHLQLLADRRVYGLLGDWLTEAVNGAC